MHMVMVIRSCINIILIFFIEIPIIIPLHLALRRLLLIKKPYSASTMFVTHGIPSFFELLRKCIYNFSQRISLSPNSIIVACLAPSVLFYSLTRQTMVEISTILTIFFLTVIYLFIYCMYVFLITMFLLCIWTNV